MRIQMIKKYADFFERTKNEPIVIMQGSKRSGKTAQKLIDGGTKLSTKNGFKMQYFSESAKQQNFGLADDFKTYFNPILHNFKHDGTQKTYTYKFNQLAFVNIPNNIRADDIANSMGACSERYLNEVNMFSRSTFEKLRINNTGQIFVDYNPWKKFYIEDLITDTNFLKTTWRDNPFLSKNQIDLFLQWTNEGMNSPVGSYPYWRWQVMCEGNFTELTGELFTPENIHFVSKIPDNLHSHIIMSDPSNAKGGDYFPIIHTAISEGNCYLIDSMSRNHIEKVLIAEKIKQWQRGNNIQRTFIETNGEFGLKFYNDCVAAGIDVDGWYSRNDKYERIMANFDVITSKFFVLDTPENREFIQQVYTFAPDCANDDNIDCINNAILAYIRVFGELKVLF